MPLKVFKGEGAEKNGLFLGQFWPKTSKNEKKIGNYKNIFW